MTKLATLRSRLGSLRRRRAGVRLGNAFSGFAVALAWLLVADFAVDWSLEMDRPQRFVALVICAAAAYWAYRKFTAPFLGRRETELDMALLVEKQQEIDSDLVAALQFEKPEAAGWGSAHLEAAVIDYVADFGKSLNVFQGFSRRQLARRAGTLAVTLLVVGAATGLFPHHAGAFFNRLLLGSRHYPTRTVIERIVINGEDVPLESRNAVLRTPFGRPIKFEIHCSGELPQQGRVDLTTHRSPTGTTVDLVPRTAPGPGPQVFHGELPRLVDSVSYELFLGDAWTDPAELQVIPLPVITVDLKPIVPSYAANAEKPAEEKLGSRQVSVIEGSAVELRVLCGNKPLAEATLTVAGQNYSLKAEDQAQQQWALPIEGTPFSAITEPLRYQIQVRDRDGLELEQPIVGFIRIKADRSPRIVAAMISRKVLPTAKPRVSFGASDDYGIARVRVLRQLVREDGTMDEFSEDIEVVPPAQQPRPSLRGQYRLDLKSLNLAKGDQLKITLEATDYRGPLEGKSSLSEPLVLDVTDVQGFLAGMVEADEQSARRLDAIIQRQLGIGESK